MEQKLARLDSPGIASNLRYMQRSAQYTRRPLQPVILNDIRPVRSRPKQVAEPVAPALADVKSQSSSTNAAQSKSVPQVSTAKSAQAAPAEGPAQVRRSGAHFHLRAPHLPRTKTAWVQSGLYTAAFLLIIMGGVIGLGGLRANRQVAAQVQHLQKAAADNAGKDNQSTATAPSTDKPSEGTIASYTVAPTLPRYINIAKLNIHARVLSEGLDRKGALQVPWNIYDTGWYNSSAQPGQAGATLLAGHSGIGNMEGTFHDLAKLRRGDEIDIVRGDGQKLMYHVATVQVVNVNDVDMKQMMQPAEMAQSGLNLITCAGERIPGTTELNQRVLVRAILQ